MSNTETTTSVLDTINQSDKKKRSWKSIIIPLILILMATAAGWYFYNGQPSSKQLSYKTEAVKRGNIKMTITTTGNLEPLNQVDIGTELSGTVEEVFIDTNDEVKKGQKLARLNTTQLKDTVTKSKASLDSAKARVKQANASIKEAKLKRDRLRQLYKTSGGKLPSKGELDTANATLERAQADAAVAKANVTSAKAEVRSVETNLAKAIITSPINGIVLDRAVEPGQTVASSLSAPTLFTLAEDLSKMELQVGVDEADVGRVKDGQMAEFSVDAWAGRSYPAQITRVSLGATTSENVVSYLTTLSVENDDLSLRPGMTATATITTDSRENVLLLPNAALRFTPEKAEGVDNKKAEKSSSSIVSQLMSRRRPSTPRKKRKDSDKKPAKNNGRAQVWIMENNKPTPISIKTGITDGKWTEIISDKLAEGTELITSQQASQP